MYTRILRQHSDRTTLTTTITEYQVVLFGKKKVPLRMFKR